jgi:hypothetical protein
VGRLGLGAFLMLYYARAMMGRGLGPVAITLLGSVFDTVSGVHSVTATPSVGDLIVIIAANTGFTSGNNPSDDNSAGAYTLITSAVKAASADGMEAWVRTTLVPSSVSTVFTYAPGATTGGGFAVLKISGISRVGAAAVRQSGKLDNQLSGSSPGASFPGAALAGNAVICAAFNATNPATLTATTLYTKLADIGYLSPTTGLAVEARNIGETATTISWGSNSATAWSGLVLEMIAG